MKKDNWEADRVTGNAMEIITWKCDGNAVIVETTKWQTERLVSCQGC